MCLLVLSETFQRDKHVKTLEIRRRGHTVSHRCVNSDVTCLQRKNQGPFYKFRFWLASCSCDDLGQDASLSVTLLSVSLQAMRFPPKAYNKDLESAEVTHTCALTLSQ